MHNSKQRSTGPLTCIYLQITHLVAFHLQHNDLKNLLLYWCIAKQAAMEQHTVAQQNGPLICTTVFCIAIITVLSSCKQRVLIVIAIPWRCQSPKLELLFCWTVAGCRCWCRALLSPALGWSCHKPASHAPWR